MKIGWMELLVVIIVALIVVGPDKLPDYARKAGKALKEFKKISADLTSEITEDVVKPLNEAAKPLKEAAKPINEASDTLKKTTKDIKKQVSNIGKEDMGASKEEEKKEETVEEKKEEENVL
ncbi:MAG: Sec-independent protein translocase protein TatB [Erysipelotrichaceae bacterium]